MIMAPAVFQFVLDKTFWRRRILVEPDIGHHALKINLGARMDQGILTIIITPIIYLFLSNIMLDDG